MNKLLIVLLLMCGVAQGQIESTAEGAIGFNIQPLGASQIYDCGVWKTKSDTSDWVTVDTLNIPLRDAMRKRPNVLFDKSRDWVYDRIKSTDPLVGLATLEYNPCKGTQSNYEQYRICGNTGIRQRRTIVYRGYYEKELSPYDEVVKKFTDE